MYLALFMAVAAVAGFICGLVLAHFVDDGIGSETVNLWPVNPRHVAPPFRGRRAKDESFVLATPAEIMRYLTCRIATGMFDERIPLADVAEELGVDADDLERWMELYREDGIDALLEPSVPQAGGQERGGGDGCPDHPLPVETAEPAASGGDNRGPWPFAGTSNRG